jgi:hypothetical protein
MSRASAAVVNLHLLDFVAHERREINSGSNICMSQFSTSAILLRRTEYRDYDLILSLFSHSHGKVSVIAKSIRKAPGDLLESWSFFRKWR